MRSSYIIPLAVVLLFSLIAHAADVVQTDIMQPGTQPGEIEKLLVVDNCNGCHGEYDLDVEPVYNWRGSMMANAGRDPLFWATLAVVEQDFDGAGNLCIRCHSPTGWLAGNAIPTDGSGLTELDENGVECGLCHKLTNPDNSEHIGVQTEPFWANNEGDPDWNTGDPVIAYYGTGMYVLWGRIHRMGPYADAKPKHAYMQSQFHRSVDFCGTCHDVSNPAVGDLAIGNGAQYDADVTYDGTPGAPVEGKAAFNNFPYEYGIVERTQSEYKSGLLSQTRVSDYESLPDDLKAGAIKAAYYKAQAAGNGGNYSDGTVRYFSCQTCHEPPVTGRGANRPDTPERTDLPLHDLTGGNYWVPDAIRYLDSQDLLRLGGGLTATQRAALEDGKTRAKTQLENAAVLEMTDNTLKVINTAGHKLPTGYPEGRRMWLNIKWYDETGNTLLREDGAYGPIELQMDLDGDGANDQVNTILDLEGTNTKIYECYPAITQEWADQLVALNWPEDMPLSFDRTTGDVKLTLGELAAQEEGSYIKTFHFVLNNKIAMDNRIPPYGMSYDEAKVRNALPKPAEQYGSPGDGGVYNYWDEIALHPPEGAARAEIRLLYQPTSWEYVQFLYLANDGSVPFLADEGNKLLDAWLNNGMAEPYVMAATTWTAPTAAPISELLVSELETLSVDTKGNPVGPGSMFVQKDTVGIGIWIEDSEGFPVSGSTVLLSILDPEGKEVASLEGLTDENGQAFITWKTSKKQGTGEYTVVVNDVLLDGYFYNSGDSTKFNID